MIKIGIDPGVKTGIAEIMDTDLFSPKLSLYTTDFWGCYEFIRKNYAPSCTEIHIEDTNDLPVFRESSNNRIQSRMGRNVGAVCREASLLIEGFQRLGYKVVVHNNKKSAKLDAKQFKVLTGWQGRTNQHERDAAALIL